jgi:hypothetical protein
MPLMRLLVKHKSSGSDEVDAESEGRLQRIQNRARFCCLPW